jgi:hypothetical protein
VRISAKTCQAEDCDNTAKCKGYCSRHYDRLRRRGTLDPYVKIRAVSDTKLCTMCNQVLKNDSFYKRNQNSLRAWCKVCVRSYSRKQHLANKYNLTVEEYEDLLELQNYVCAICGKENVYADQDRRLAVDHDHMTGQVRGLLCQTDNRMLGLAGDSVDILKNALAYLERFK